MFGVFQSFYQLHLLKQHSSSQISWIGSVQGSLLFFVSALSGPLYDMGYMRQLLYVGSILTVLGMMLTSACTRYWQIFLAQGVMMGAGNGCLFLCCVTIVGQYFTTRKTIATGIAAAGGSLAGIVYPILFNQIWPSIGFGWATRSIAFIMLATSAIPLLCLRQRIPATACRDLIRLAELRNTSFMLYNFGTFFGFMGIYVVFFYIQIYAISETLISESLSFYLVSILNAGGLLGRIAPNLVAEKLGTLNMQSLCALFTTVLAFVWIAVHTTGGIIAFAPTYAFVAGAFSSLPGPTIVSMSPTLEGLGTRMGINLFITGLGVLLGTPIAGTILHSLGGAEERRAWQGLQLWCGVSLAIATFFMLATKITRDGWRVRVKTYGEE